MPRLWWVVAALVLSSGLVALGARRLQDGALVVESSVENFRDAPNGQKLGTLVQGTEIEKISEDGKWVRFRVEGWIWGPSLEGFEEEEEKPEEKREAAPRLPLQDAQPRVKRAINDKYGVFYSLDLDEDLKRLNVRFRVRSIEREVLERRQMAVQREVLGILEGEVEFDAIRIGTNRPDGTGQVGAELAETRVEDVRRYAGGEVAEWKAHTRISTDGGKTWSP